MDFARYNDALTTLESHSAGPHLEKSMIQAGANFFLGQKKRAREILMEAKKSFPDDTVIERNLEHFR